MKEEKNGQNNKEERKAAKEKTEREEDSKGKRKTERIEKLKTGQSVYSSNKEL